MSYPTLEQYNEALQHPQSALVDPELKSGTIATTGLGLPLALCGGFALTYTISTGRTKYAVRCFHKHSNALEKRYSAISSRLKSLRSPYFLDFEFQPQGVRVNGSAFPVVKMVWASGNTLGEFLEGRYRNRADLQLLSSTLHTLSKYLDDKHLAHGDVQPGNVMVFNDGRSVQLIDYDGMFVDDLRTLGSAELGHRNFQHPGRTSSSWDSRLDRFSFITLNLALRVLEVHPDLWNKTRSDGDAILFKANDFADPARSDIFVDLFGRSQFSEDAKNFAAICKASFDKVPTLEEFLARKNIPQAVITISPTTKAVRYLSAFTVLDANDYALCLQHVGDRIELIGKIVEVKPNKTKHGKPYIFINFGPWKGQIVKISIWSEGLSVLTKRPDQSWVGNWISVVGLMEPPYVSKKYKYSHLSISITQANQLHVITDSEARFRLAGSSTRSPPGPKPDRSTNKEIIDGIRGTGQVPSRSSTPAQVTTSPNQAILDAIKGSRPAPTSVRKGSSAGYRSPQPSGSPVKKNDNCFIATAIYGADAPETNTLRNWRDKRLLPTMAGRALVSCYYVVSPFVAKLLKRNVRCASIVRTVLDRLILRL